ncbi:MAG: TonB family protein [Gammaproteobacteria bacterium]
MNSKSQKYRYLPALALGVVMVLIGFGAFALIRNFIGSAPPPSKKVVQEIQIIRPPPPPDLPPPPPPPPEEQVAINDPEPAPDPTPSDDPPPGEQLGLDADGSAGGDAFGLLGRKGGRDLLASGGSAYAWYGGLVKNEIVEQLGAEKQARSGDYTVGVSVWVRNDGTIERARIVRSSGNRDRDRAVEEACTRIRISQAPPADMPQPITLRIVSRA